MYLRPGQAPVNREEVARTIRNNLFGVLIGQSASGLTATHLPFLFDAERGEHGTLVGHMARANPHAQLLRRTDECLVVFTGPHAYVSPNWYVERARPPTWNYVAVHCYGRPEIVEDPLGPIARLVDRMEHARSSPWSIDELPVAEIRRLAANVIAFEILLTRIESRFKLSQGDTSANVLSVIQALDETGERALAELMSRYNQPR